MLLFLPLALLILFITFIISLCFRRSSISLKGKHVLITGGSSGIGLQAAIEVVQRGARVTLIARDPSKLASAKDCIEKKIENAKTKEVQVFSADVSDNQSQMAEVIRQSEASFGPIFMLVNCAGCSKPGRFEDLSEEDIKTTLDVNLIGSIFITQQVIKSMKRKDEGGIVVFTSSLGGLFGLFGFTVYAAAKGALIKLAEALHMELKPHNISVTVSLPPDTDTPGLHEENKRKPTETRLISESAGLFQADVVAKQLVNDALQRKFFSTVGFEGYMLGTLCAGMSPITDAFSFLSQVVFSGLFRLISSFYLWNFGKVVKKEATRTQQSKKTG